MKIKFRKATDKDAACIKITEFRSVFPFFILKAFNLHQEGLWRCF